MELKIFKSFLFIIVAFLAISRPVLAQDTSTPTPSKPALKAVKHGRKDMKISLDNLQIGFAGPEIKIDTKTMEVALNNMTFSFKGATNDFGKNFSGSFDELLPAIHLDLKDLHLDLGGDFTNQDANTNNWIQNDDNEKSKNYSKSYTMDGNDKLQIDNKYGKVQVITWNKNEVKVDVQIKAYAGNEKDAKKYLDAISISDNKVGDIISFKTNFGDNGRNSIWTIWNNRTNHKVEINYIIYMPSKNALNIDNRYGAIELPDFEGKVIINSGYGSLDAKALSHSGNDIKVRYGSASIESLTTGNLVVSYGSLDLGSVDKLDAYIDYSTAKINKIRNSGNINAHYAGIVKISELDRNFTNLQYNGSYSGLKLGTNAVNTDFDITVHYGSFEFGDAPVKVTKKTPPDSDRGFSSTQNYRGHLGKGNNDKVLNIKTSYGSVQFE